MESQVRDQPAPIYTFWNMKFAVLVRLQIKVHHENKYPFPKLS